MRHLGRDGPAASPRTGAPRSPARRRPTRDAQCEQQEAAMIREAGETARDRRYRRRDQRPATVRPTAGGSDTGRPNSSTPSKSAFPARLAAATTKLCPPTSARAEAIWRFARRAQGVARGAARGRARATPAPGPLPPGGRWGRPSDTDATSPRSRRDRRIVAASTRARNAASQRLEARRLPDLLLGGRLLGRAAGVVRLPPPPRSRAACARARSPRIERTPSAPIAVAAAMSAIPRNTRAVRMVLLRQLPRLEAGTPLRVPN